VTSVSRASGRGAPRRRSPRAGPPRRRELVQEHATASSFRVPDRLREVARRPASPPCAGSRRRTGKGSGARLLGSTRLGLIASTISRAREVGAGRPALALRVPEGGPLCVGVAWARGSAESRRGCGPCGRAAEGPARPRRAALDQLGEGEKGEGHARMSGPRLFPGWPGPGEAALRLVGAVEVLEEAELVVGVREIGSLRPTSA
jgi:hypothetical protein